MTAPLPDALNVLCLADDQPRPDLPVLITLAMTQKNPHRFIFGPTDFRGRIEIVRPDIEERMKAAIEMFPADYAGINEFAGDIAVSPLTSEEIQAALKAFDMFSKYVPYSWNYQEMLLKGYASLYQHPAKRLEIGDVAVWPANPALHVRKDSLKLGS